MTPEIEDGYYNNKIDLKSIGVLIYELYYNNYIFKEKMQKKQMIINIIAKLLKKLQIKILIIY